MLVEYSDSDGEETLQSSASGQVTSAVLQKSNSGPAPSASGLNLPPPRASARPSSGLNLHPPSGARGAGSGLVLPAPSGGPARKQIDLQTLLSRNESSLSVDVAQKLPTGFFEEPPVETAPEPRAPSANGPRGRLSSMLPPPKNAPVRRGITADAAGGMSTLGRLAVWSNCLTPRAASTCSHSAQPPASVGKATTAPARHQGLSPLPPAPKALPRVDPCMYAPDDAARGASLPSWGGEQQQVHDEGITAAYEDFMPSYPAVPPYGAGALPGPALPPELAHGGPAKRGAHSDFLEAQQSEQVISVSMDELKRSIGPARQYEIPKPAEDVKISANFWNRRSGEVEQHFKPSKLQKRKHQINSLAFDCAEKATELAQRARMGNKTKAETHAKYGW